jgi:transposase
MGLLSQLRVADAKGLRLFLKQVTDKRTYVRALVLCLLAEGQSLAAVTKDLQISRREVYRLLHRYLHGHDPQSLRDNPRSGRPCMAREITPKRILAALDRDPRRQGFVHNAWTVATLTQYLNHRYGTEVSAATLRRRMHDIGLRYKLPKYVYEEKEPNRTQKKGRSSANSTSNQKVRWS